MALGCKGTSIPRSSPADKAAGSMAVTAHEKGSRWRKVVDTGLMHSLVQV